ncbi:MAK10-like protein [Tanacetum coccineum]
MGDVESIRTLGGLLQTSQDGTTRIPLSSPLGTNVALPILQLPSNPKTIRLVQIRMLIPRDFEDIALYDNESWNDPRDFTKPAKAISLPQNVPSTSDRRLIELENQVQRLMEAHLAPTQPTQVNKILPHVRSLMVPTTLSIAWKIPNKPLLNMHPHVLTKREIPNAHHTPPLQSMLSKHVPRRQTFPRQASCNPGWGVELLDHAPIYNAILDKYVESLELGKNGLAFIQGEVSAKMEDPGLFTLPCRLGDSKPFDTLADLGSCVNIIPLYLFKKHNIGLLEETDHIFGLADGTKSYPVEIVKDVEVHIGKLKLLNDFYVIDMKKDPETPLLVGRGFLATANAVIDCRMTKIAVEEGITRESYKPRPSSDGPGAQIPYHARKDFLDCHLPGEWEIARDVEINPFRDVLVFRKMVEFLGAIPINLKSNMWESEDLINNPINWNKPPKNGDEAWHAKIRLIVQDGEKPFTKTYIDPPPLESLRREKVKEDHRLGPLY